MIVILYYYISQPSLSGGGHPTICQGLGGGGGDSSDEPALELPPRERETIIMSTTSPRHTQVHILPGFLRTNDRFFVGAVAGTA